jgi:hypothetical protein
MRIKEKELQTRIKTELSEKTKLSFKAEAALFAQAEELLAARRDRIQVRQDAAVRASRSRKQAFDSIQGLIAAAFEKFVLYPSGPMAATAFAALIIAFLAYPRVQKDAVRFTYADLPEFKKFNDAPARYDAERIHEQQAYEREVENAHKSTSGGL